MKKLAAFFFMMFVFFLAGRLLAQETPYDKYLKYYELFESSISPKIKGDVKNIEPALGKPVKIKKKVPSERGEYLIYDGLEFDIESITSFSEIDPKTSSAKYLTSKEIIQIILTSDKYTTPFGIKIGDPKEKIIKVFGVPIPKDGAAAKGVNGDRYEYYPDDPNYGVTFIFKNNKLSKIIFDCFPD